MKDAAIRMLFIQAFLGGSLAYPLFGADLWGAVAVVDWRLRLALCLFGAYFLFTAGFVGALVIKMHAQRWPR